MFLEQYIDLILLFASFVCSKQRWVLLQQWPKLYFDLLPLENGGIKNYLPCCSLMQHFCYSKKKNQKLLILKT